MTSAALRPTPFLDYESIAVRNFVSQTGAHKLETDVDRAVRLYYAVRDGIDYEVYGTDLSREGLRASAIVSARRGFCVQKSILYAAVTRSLGIPSRIVVAQVRNHLASERLKKLVGGETFVHWLNAVYLNGRWVRATPVFNSLLCRLYGMAPLEFDGETDSESHPYEGDERMEFIRYFGEFDDVDYDELMGLMRREHPAMFTAGGKVPGSGRLADEAPAR